MKALTVQQPWAELIARGDKTVELRTWGTSYRGPLAITSSLARATSDAAAAWEHVDGPRGTLIALVQLHTVEQAGADDGDVSDFACAPVREGVFVWGLELVRVLAPRTVRGRLGLWEISDELIRSSRL